MNNNSQNCHVSANSKYVHFGKYCAFLFQTISELFISGGEIKSQFTYEG